MRITFIGFGEGAAAFSVALAARGSTISAYDVLLSEPGGAGRLKARAGSTAVSFLSLTEALRDAEYVLSNVTASRARAAAEECAPHLQPGQVYLDLSATEPTIKMEIARIIEASGARFVEGAELRSFGMTGADNEILLGGPHARDAERDLHTVGLNARFYSDEIGKASLFKMLRSVFSKGLEALLLEFLIAAERGGIRDDVWSDVTALFISQPFEKVAKTWVRTHSSAHQRRLDELRQVLDVLRSLDVDPIMTSAAYAVFERSGQLGLVTQRSPDDVIKFLNERL